MKKIVSAALAASLLAGAAFADVKISTNYRLGTNLLTINPGEATGTDDVQALNNLKSNWGDTTKIAASGEHAGIELDLKTSESAIGMDYGYAWLGWGNFKLYGGTKDTRGALKRVNPLDGNWWNNYCEYGKPGIHKDVKAGLDASNLTVNTAGSKEVAFTAEYMIVDNIFVRAALFDMHSSDADKEAGQESLGDKLRFGVQFDMKHDMFNLNATFKYSKDDVTTADDNELTFGIFVNPILVPGLDLLLGFTYADIEATSDDAFIGIDVRASYKMDALTLSTLNNITLNDGDMISWHTLGAAYKVNDVLTAAGLQLILNSTAKAAWADAGDAGNKSEYLAVRPYVDLTAQKNAVLSIGAELKFVNLMADSDEDVDFQFRVPVVMRVKL